MATASGFTPEQERFIRDLVEQEIEAILNTQALLRAGLSLVGTLTSAQQRALLKNGVLTIDGLAEAEQEMRASAAVERALDPNLSAIDKDLERLRDLLRRLTGEEEQP